MRMGTRSLFTDLLGVFCLLGSLGASAENPATPPAADAGKRVVPAAGREFEILEFEVVGNSVLRADEIEAVLGFYLGEKRKPEDVDAARASLEKLYKALGYKTVAVAIPKQTIRNGIVQLQVTEARLGDLRFNGERYSSIEQIRLEVPALSAGGVPDFDDVQQQLTYANRIPVRRVTPTLKPNPGTGQIDVELNVEDELPVTASIEWNNQYSRYTSHQRLAANLGYRNLFQRGHEASLLYYTSPDQPSEGATWALRYHVPLGNGEQSLDLSAVRSDSDVAVLDGGSVLGRQRSAGLTYSVPLTVPAESRWYPSLLFGIDYKEQGSNAISFGANDVPVELSTPLRYMPITLGFSQLYRGDWLRVQNDNSLVLTTAAVGSDEEQLDLSRYRARGNRFYLRSSAGFSAGLPWGFSLRSRVVGQYTNHALLAAEQLAGGGVSTVRGYLEAEAVADTGALGQLELRLPSLPDYFAGQAWANWLTEIQPYAFGDAARLVNNGPFPDRDTPRAYTLASSGGGLSLRLREAANAQLVWSITLIDGPATPTFDQRLLFKLSAGF